MLLKKYINDKKQEIEHRNVISVLDCYDFEEEKDLLLYYMNLIKGKETIVLPKLKTNKVVSYQYKLN